MAFAVPFWVEAAVSFWAEAASACSSCSQLNLALCAEPLKCPACGNGIPSHGTELAQLAECFAGSVLRALGGAVQLQVALAAHS